MPLYLSKYVGNGTLGSPFIPFGSDQKDWSAIDLRPDGGATREGNGLNACLFQSSENVVGLPVLGYDKTEHLAACVHKKLNLQFGVDGTRTLQDAIIHLMTRPPKNGWNPVRGGIAGQAEIWLGDNWAYPSTSYPVMRRRLARDSFGKKSKFEWLKYAAAFVAGFPLGAVLASDDFDRANDTTLGANWTFKVNPIPISGNAAATSLRVFHIEFYNGITWPDNQYSKGIIGTCATANDEGLGAAARITTDASGTCYLIQPNTSRSRMFKDLSNSFTQLGSDGAAYANGNTIELDANGTSISALKNGSTIIGPITDSGISSGNSGLLGFGTATIDSWEGGDFTVGGSPGKLLTLLGVG